MGNRYVLADEYILTLKAKIRVLEDIVQLRDSEIKLYRELLEEIRLDKTFMGSEKPLQKLNKIDELIAEMHKERKKVLDEGNSV